MYAYLHTNHSHREQSNFYIMKITITLTFYNLALIYFFVSYIKQLGGILSYSHSSMLRDIKTGVQVGI